MVCAKRVHPDAEAKHACARSRFYKSWARGSPGVSGLDFVPDMMECLYEGLEPARTACTKRAAINWLLET